MTENEALELIRSALNEVQEGAGNDVTPETDLVQEDVLDSLDLMNFLFELETANGKKIEAIDENYSDYRVSKLIELLTAQ